MTGILCVADYITAELHHDQLVGSVVWVLRKTGISQIHSIDILDTPFDSSIQVGFLLVSCFSTMWLE